jgi:hypothetical protein
LIGEWSQQNRFCLAPITAAIPKHVSEYRKWPSDIQSSQALGVLRIHTKSTQLAPLPVLCPLLRESPHRQPPAFPRSSEHTLHPRLNMSPGNTYRSRTGLSDTDAAQHLAALSTLNARSAMLAVVDDWRNPQCRTVHRLLAWSPAPQHAPLAPAKPGQLRETIPSKLDDPNGFTSPWFLAPDSATPPPLFALTPA